MPETPIIFIFVEDCTVEDEFWLRSMNWDLCFRYVEVLAPIRSIALKRSAKRAKTVNRGDFRHQMTPEMNEAQSGSRFESFENPYKNSSWNV